MSIQSLSTEKGISPPHKSKKAMQSLVCKFCKAHFYRSPSRQRGGFCSMKCFGLAKTLPEIFCKRCGKSVQKYYHASLGNGRCRSCYLKDKKEKGLISHTSPCVQCQAPVYRAPGHRKGSSRKFGVFCNHECFGLFVRGKANPAYIDGRQPADYPSAFRRIKKFIKARETDRCFLCLADGCLDVHHIDRDKNNNKIWNLVALCRLCHNHQKGTELEVINLSNQLYSQLSEAYGYPRMFITSMSPIPTIISPTEY